jgi:hypothetical protein
MQRSAFPLGSEDFSEVAGCFWASNQELGVAAMPAAALAAMHRR